MFKTFLHFSKYTFKIQQPLHTSVELFQNVYIEKLLNKIVFEGRSIFEIVVTNQNEDENMQETSLLESSTNCKKLRNCYFIYSIIQFKC